ncbi:MAG: Fur family transcriptional regulator [Pseudomonadota bacterium]
MGKRGDTWQAAVLEILRARSEPLSAYGVIEALHGVKGRIAPPTVYRALAALQSRGLIHRLESLNAYVACACDEHNHPPILSICDDCGNVEENIEPDLVAQLTSLLDKTGFEAQRHVIEVHGVCAACVPGQASR